MKTNGHCGGYKAVGKHEIIEEAAMRIAAVVLIYCGLHYLSKSR
jgi:hypothetical protein